MAYNMNKSLMVQLLGYIESKTRNGGLDELPRLDRYTSDEIGAHVKLAVEYGYITVIHGYSGSPIITGLTTLGMQVSDSQSVWTQA